MRTSILLIFLFACSQVLAQNVKKSASESGAVKQSNEKRKELLSKSILNNYPSQNVGPVVQGGRITDLHVLSDEHYLVGFASGGLWETRNHGITFEPIFDEQGSLGIGDFAVGESDPSVIYVGTGENNSSRSSYAGDGIYKSTDGGKTWDHIGLSNTQHIGRVVVHPENADILWVAAMGALYSHNDERGVYKSLDGGNTWTKTLYINDSTGIIDLVINPENPDQLWAAAWERTRKAWNFKGNGPGSGIYRSDDGGTTWEKKMNGFPQGDFIGRIGLDISQSDPNIIYAFLDNQKEKEGSKEEQKEKEEINLGDFRDMTVQHLLKMDNELLNKFLDDQGFPKKYDAEQIKKDIRQSKYAPRDIADYFGDANEALFNTGVEGAQLYRSDDRGDTWKMVNSYDLDGVYFTYGYYFGEVRVDPNDPDKAYIFGVPLLKTSDGGKTYARIDTIGNVHVDHHALWIDPDNSKHLLLGNDGGLYESYDEGANWHHWNSIPAGQFYTVNYDMEKPYNIYGGLQDNGTLVGSSNSIPNRTEFWDRVFGGDGMYVQPDPRDHKLVYAGFQFGNYYRIHRGEGKFDKITPQHDIGEDQLRFNWRTPLIMSPHNPDIIYIAAQKVYRSMDQGDTWQKVSEDLTHNYPQGNVPYSTISSLEESPLKFGLLYAGTDDGRIHRTDAAGGTWEEITQGLPEDLWISSIEPSAHQIDRVYVTLNGYRFDDFSTYVYVSEDKGKTWKSLKSNLPEVVVNVITEDPVNQNLLYLGTDHGTYVSFDRGEEWNLYPATLNVASYDIKVHPRENDVIIGTHGRSIYVTDVSDWQSMEMESMKKPVVAFSPTNIRYRPNWGERSYPYTDVSEPSAVVWYYSKDEGNIRISIEDPEGDQVLKEKITAKKGFNKYTWNLKDNGDYITPGNYKITFSKGGEESGVQLEVKD